MDISARGMTADPSTMAMVTMRTMQLLLSFNARLVVPPTRRTLHYSTRDEGRDVQAKHQQHSNNSVLFVELSLMARGILKT
jgi:hypothetical protein